MVAGDRKVSDVEHHDISKVEIAIQFSNIAVYCCRKRYNNFYLYMVYYVSTPSVVFHFLFFFRLLVVLGNVAK